VQNGRQPAPAGAVAISADRSGNDHLALALSIAALVLAAAGLTVAALRGRPLA